MYSAVRSSKHHDQSFKRQGSLRKVLPTEEDKANIFGRQHEDLNKVYQMYRQEYIVLAEYKMVQTENIQGVYVIPSRESSLKWFGFIYVRNGPFEDGVFRFTIFLDEQFPNSEHPQVVFSTNVPHPVIHPDTNELNLLMAFPTWNKDEQHIWQVLKFIQWCFDNTEATVPHSINKEAVDLLQTNKEIFNSKAKDAVKHSQDHLYDEPPTDDKHYIVFNHYNTNEHDRIRVQMLNCTNDSNTKMGLSWVMPGSCKPLGRSPSPHSESES